jgi:hypothetical protein
VTESLKQRTLDAVNRAMLYCLRAMNGARCVTVLGKDKIISVDELYDTIIYLRGMIPNRDEARELRSLVSAQRTIYTAAANQSGMPADHKMEYEKRAAKLSPILEKLEVLSGQA